MDQNALNVLHMMLFIMPFFILAMWAIVLIPFWMIYKKAGFSPWLSLLMIVPLANIIMLYVVAFSEWKVAPVTPLPPPGYPPPGYQTIPPQV